MHTRSRLALASHLGRTNGNQDNDAFSRRADVPVALSACEHKKRLVFCIVAAFASLSVAQSEAAQTNFCKAILAKGEIVLNGGVLIDSFNSLDPARSTNGRYDPAKRKDSGDIASTSDSVRTITETGSGKVYGHVATGPNGTVVTTGNASMGSMAWVDGGNRGVQPGWYTNNLNVSIPDVQLPGVNFVSMPATGGTVNGTNYTYVLNAGNYRRSSSFTMSGSQKMAIRGRVVLYFTGSFHISGSAFVYITPGSSLTLYLAGDSQLSGGGIVNGTGFATNCAYFGLPSCVNIDNTGSSDFTGTIYAPQADVKLSGGGSAVANFVGAVVAKSVTMTGNYRFHYDESLCGNFNRPPVANNDNYTTLVNTLLTINAPGVLANDTDPDGNPLTAVLGTSPTHGTLITFNANGSFTYRPDTNYVGTDSFTYRANDASATSSAATVTITINPAPIVVITPPANQIVCVGGTAVFSVTASGSGLTYQWRKGTTVLAGKTNSTLTLANVTTTDAGTYSVRIANSVSSVTNSATLTVNVPVTATPLTNLMRAIGANAVFSTVASGTGPLTYVWRKNGAIISGQTGSSLVLMNLTTNATATYSVVVSGACGSVTNSAMLVVDECFPSVDVMLVIDRSGSMEGQPWRDAKTAASNFVNNLKFGTNADLAGLVSYNDQATLDRRLTNSASALRQAIGAIPAADGYTSITRGLQTAQDELASGRHNPEALPVILLLSDGMPTLDDTPAQALAAATAAKNAGSRIFTVGLGDVDHALMAGIASRTNDYFYTANSSQLTALFNAISTIICRPPTNIVATGPTNVTVCAGATATFSVGATGCMAFRYQWSKDGVALAGRTNSILVISNVTAASAGTYSVAVLSDCQNKTNSATLTVNQPALVTTAPQSQASFVGSNATFGVTASGTGLSYQWFFNGATVGSGSTLTLNNLATNQAGTYCVVIGGVCGGPVTNCATLTFQNRRPVANNDSYTTPEDTALNIQPPGVLNNDSDPDGDSLTAILFAQPMHGTVTLNPNGSFTYRPFTNYNGPDSFAYHANDSKTNSNLAMVNISVTPANDAPVARDDAYSTPSDTTLTVTAPGVLANDSDSENNPLSTVLVTNPAHGSLTLNANGSFNYVPNTNYSGLDVFTYKATDGTATSGVATVTITVVPTNVVVIIPPRNQTNCPGGTAVFSVTATGTALTYQWLFGTNALASQTNSTLVLTDVIAADAGTYCVVVGAATGAPVTNCAALVVKENVIVTTPPVNQEACPASTVVFNVAATGTALTYQWYRGIARTVLAGEINSALVLTNVTLASADLYTVVVSGACGVPVTNSAQLIVNLNVAVTTPPINQTSFVGSNVTFSVGAWGTSLRFQWFFNGTQIGSNAVLTLNNLTTNQAGTYCVVISGICGPRTTNCAILTIQNRAPLANNDAYTIDEDTTLNVEAPGVLGNDSDPDGDVLNAVPASNPLHGTLTLNPNGSFTYRPVTNYNGTDTFTYRASDTRLQSSIATVTITIRPMNDTPIAVNDDAYTTPEDTVLTVPAPGVLTNDIDMDLDVLHALIASLPTNGTVVLNTNGGFLYTPNTNYIGIDTFTYRATDGIATSGLATVTIAVIPVNDRPVAVNDSYVTPEDTALTITAPGVLGNDIDADTNPLTAQLLTNPAHGTVALNADGSFTYRPNTNYNGPDSFTYRAVDSATNSEPATVSIEVTPVNDPPTTGIAGDQYTTLEDQSLTVAAPGVLANDSDVDLDPLTAVLVSGPSNGTLALNANGSFTYQPNANYFGEDTFMYRANDGKTNSLPALVRITVVPVNDAPGFTGGGDQDCNESSVARTIVDWARNISVGPANESGQTAQFIVSNDNNALFAVQPTIAANGTLTYTPAASVFGVANVRVMLRDSGGTANGGVDTSGEVVFRITVNAPPTVSIVSPANGAGLLYPATLSVIASANDPDGAVTNVQFLVNGVVWTNVATAPFYFILSNAGVGFYQFSAIASDNCGLVSTSAAVSIEVITNVIVAKGEAIFNPQVGLFEQYVIVSNRTSETWANGVRLFIPYFHPTNRVWNATGTNNGIPYIDNTNSVPPGGSVTNIVQYHMPDDRVVANPDLFAVPLPFDRTIVIPQITQILPAGPMLNMHFISQRGRFYAIESTEDLMRWTTNPLVLPGTGSIIICPEERTSDKRFYRVRMLP